MNATYYRGKLSVETDLGKFQRELKSKFEINITTFSTILEDVKIICNELNDKHYTAILIYHPKEGDLVVFNKCDILILE